MLSHAASIVRPPYSSSEQRIAHISTFHRLRSLPYSSQLVTSAFHTFESIFFSFIERIPLGDKQQSRVLFRILSLGRWGKARSVTKSRSGEENGIVIIGTNDSVSRNRWSDFYWIRKCSFNLNINFISTRAHSLWTFEKMNLEKFEMEYGRKFERGNYILSFYEDNICAFAASFGAAEGRRSEIEQEFVICRGARNDIAVSSRNASSFTVRGRKRR